MHLLACKPPCAALHCNSQALVLSPTCRCLCPLLSQTQHGPAAAVPACSSTAANGNSGQRPVAAAAAVGCWCRPAAKLLDDCASACRCAVRRASLPAAACADLAWGCACRGYRGVRSSNEIVARMLTSRDLTAVGLDSPSSRLLTRQVMLACLVIGCNKLLLESSTASCCAARKHLRPSARQTARLPAPAVQQCSF